MKPARERTPFNNPHTVTVRRVSTADMAEMRRDGATQPEVAEAFGMGWYSIRDRLLDGGWHLNGQPVTSTSTLPPPIPTPNLSWQEDAACTQGDPEIWHPEKGAGGTNSLAAKRICAHCPVQAHCLDYALSMGENPTGIWAATTQLDRKRLRRAMAEEEAS